MRGIARDCDIELALVQYHFNDKLSLWTAVLDDVFGDYLAKLEAVMRGVAGRRASEQLAVFLETLIRHAATDAVFVGIMSHARMSLGPDTEAFRERIRGRSRDTVELIRAAQADGEVVPGDPVVIFYMMVGAALRIFALAADVPDLADSPEAIAALLDDQVRTCIAVFLRTADTARPATRPLADDTPQHRPAPAIPLESDPTSSVYLFSSLDSVVRRSLEKELKDLEITQAQMIALVSIANQPRMSSVKLARLLDVSPQTVLLFVKALEDKGFIRREADQRKRRALPIEVTSAGAALLARLGEAMGTAESALLDTLSFEERGVLRGLLLRVLKRHRPSVLSAGTPIFRPRSGQPLAVSTAGSASET